MEETALPAAGGERTRLPPGPAPSWSGQPLSLRPEPAAVREELPAAIWGAFAGSLRAACGGHGRRLHLRRSVRRAGTSRQRPEAEGSGAHCRGPRLSARTRLQGAASGGGELSTAQSLTNQGALKKESAEQPPHPRLACTHTVPHPPQGLPAAKHCSQRQPVTPWRAPAGRTGQPPQPPPEAADPVTPRARGGVGRWRSVW